MSRGLHPATLRYKERLAAARLERARKREKVFDPVTCDSSTLEERRAVLHQLSQVVVELISYGELTKRRRQFDSIKNRKFPIFGNCWACRMVPATHRHHLVLLRNGGSVTGRKNVVFLCADCHTDIHPWMRETCVEVDKNFHKKVAPYRGEAAHIVEQVALGTLNLAQAEIGLLEVIRRVFNDFQK